MSNICKHEFDTVARVGRFLAWRCPDCGRVERTETRLDAPLPTVNCIQVGHNYNPHEITEVCMVAVPVTDTPKGA